MCSTTILYACLLLLVLLVFYFGRKNPLSIRSKEEERKCVCMCCSCVPRMLAEFCFFDPLGWPRRTISIVTTMCMYDILNSSFKLTASWHRGWQSPFLISVDAWETLGISGGLFRDLVYDVVVVGRPVLRSSPLLLSWSRWAKNVQNFAMNLHKLETFKMRWLKPLR